jgi:spore coat protein H
MRQCIDLAHRAGRILPWAEEATMIAKARGGEAYRLLEVSLVFVFLLATTALVVFNPSQGINRVETIPSSMVIQAYAYAMPAEGWAPLTVYFSAFGSQSSVGEIVNYEWDLDGNGRYDVNATLNGGYASYVYKKSGEYLVTLRVTDAQGNTAAESVMVKVRYPASSSVDYWTVFNDSQVRRVELRLTQANWDLMWLNPPSKTRVEADIVLFGETLESVAVSMKGNGSLEMSGEKKSWKIDTNYFIPDQEYHNLKQLLFHNNFADASMLREKMAYDMMDFAGVPAGHTAYVEMWIDIVDDDQPSQYWGIYTMVERVDSKFVANRFGSDNGIGNLYKADAWFDGGGADLAYYGEDIENYPKPRGEVAYGLQTNMEEPDYSDIIYLCYIIDGVDYASPDEFAVALEQVFNVDGYLRYLAVIFTNLNMDTYPYTGNNYYIYNNPATGKFEFLPWDLNNSWGNFSGDAQFPLYGKPCCMGPQAWTPLFTHVFQVKRYRQAYSAYVDLLVRFWFNEQDFRARTDAWHALIGPYLTKGTGDKMYAGPAAMFTVDRFTQDRLYLISLTSQRAQYLRSVLDSGQWKTEIPEANTKPVPSP